MLWLGRCTNKLLKYDLKSLRNTALRGVARFWKGFGILLNEKEKFMGGWFQIFFLKKPSQNDNLPTKKFFGYALDCSSVPASQVPMQEFQTRKLQMTLPCIFN